MTAPPGLAPTTETAAGHNRQAEKTDSAPTSKREAFRHLRAELGVTGAQAHALFVAYERDVADARRIGNDSGRSDAAFVDWLLRQAPGGRTRAVRKWRLGEGGGWAVRS